MNEKYGKVQSLLLDNLTKATKKETTVTSDSD